MDACQHPQKIMEVPILPTCPCCRSQGCMGGSCSHSAGPVSVGGSAWSIDWLCLIIHCQHSWMGVEGKVKCTRKRAGTDCIMHRVRGKHAPNWDWVTATVPCLLCRHQGYVVLPFIPSRLHWCQATLWFLLLLHSFSFGLEHFCGSVQKSLLYCKNKSEANPFLLQVSSTHLTFQDLCLSSSFSLSLQHSCQMCVPHCSALETPSAHASYFVAQEEQYSNSVITTIAYA